MRLGLVVVASIAMLGAGDGASAEIPAGATAIELADQGYLQCYRPDTRRKTCQSIASYERIRDGVYQNTAEVSVGNGITLETSTPVWVVDGAFCGSIREQDIMAGTLRVGGSQVAEERAGATLYQLAKQLGPMTNVQLCTRYEPAAAGFTAKISMAGTYRAEMDTPVKIISASDGYRVVS
jgi:hypothetical protein